MSQADPIEVAIRAYVDAGALAGAASLVWRSGRVVQTATVGRRDLVTNLPVERDTIFRLASMTKPLTTMAALMLYDEGRFALDEPIEISGAQPRDSVDADLERKLNLSLAELEMTGGRREEAERHYLSALKIAKKTGNRAAEAQVLADLGALARRIESVIT